VLFDGGEQLTQIGSSGDQFDQTVELLAALLTVDAAVRVNIKYRIDQLLQLFVHCLTRT
jgi:hypothetical protein